MAPPVYLDWNATTPPHPSVLEAMRRTAEEAWGNPASVHAVGRRAKAVVEHARERVAGLVGFCARDVIFTSGGTEANNLAVMRPFSRDEAGRAALVTTRIEHPSILAPARELERRRAHVVWLDLDDDGRVPPEALERALRDLGDHQPVLVALAAVHHETGIVQPVPELALVAHEHGADLHLDAVQAVGRLEPSRWSGADSVALAAHKLRGPKGIGALATRPGLSPVPLLRGGSQERGLRPGTVDPVQAAGFGVAAERAFQSPAAYEGLRPLRDELEVRLVAAAARAGSRAVFHGRGARAPHVTNLRLEGWAGDELVAALDLEGICVSSGSACAAGTPEPAPAIRELFGAEAARGAVRVSLGEATTGEDVEAALAAVGRVLARGAARGSGSG